MALSRSQLQLLLVLFVFIAPVVLATVAYKYWRPDDLSNYGELIESVEFKPEGLSAASGESVDGATLRGKWLFVLVESAACDKNCAQNLYLMRQVRTATGKEQERVGRLLLSKQALPDDLSKEHVGLQQLRYTDEQKLGAHLAGADGAGRIYLVDPLGRFVLRYPMEPDGTKMLKDIQRLLKYSQIG